MTADEIGLFQNVPTGYSSSTSVETSMSSRAGFLRLDCLDDSQVTDCVRREACEEPLDPAIADHLDVCLECRGKVRRAQLLLRMIAEGYEAEAALHPSEIDLSAFAEGRLRGDAARHVAEHVRECEECESIISSIRQSL